MFARTQSVNNIVNLDKRSLEPQKSFYPSISQCSENQKDFLLGKGWTKLTIDPSSKLKGYRSIKVTNSI